jgi:hypothetical protein
VIDVSLERESAEDDYDESQFANCVVFRRKLDGIVVRDAFLVS